MEIWIQIFRMRNRGPKVSLKDYLEKTRKISGPGQENVVFRGDNGVEILK